MLESPVQVTFDSIATTIFFAVGGHHCTDKPVRKRPIPKKYLSLAPTTPLWIHNRPLHLPYLTLIYPSLLN